MIRLGYRQIVYAIMLDPPTNIEELRAGHSSRHYFTGTNLRKI